METSLRSKIATPAAAQPKAVQDVDLYLARAILILMRESPAKEGDPNNMKEILMKVIESDPYIDEYLDSVEPSPGSAVFLKNIRTAWAARKKYVATGKIKKYDPVMPEERSEDIRALAEILARTGSTVLSSDYTWNPEKIRKLPEVIRAIEAEINHPIKVETVKPQETYLHREKKMYIDAQLWISLQIQPVIRISLDK